MIIRNKKSEEKFYKFKDLKIYSSPEWLAGGMRKYRTVFESIETTYLYVELSFYNKLFDVEEWEANIVLRCYRLDSRKDRRTICEIEVNQVVSPQDNVVKIREGWGNDEAGAFWVRGDYVWEAYLDDKILGTKHFYIENGGPVTSLDNPYFELQSIKLYEGTQDDLVEEKRTYYKQFSTNDTRYIWIEFKLENLQEEDFYSELVFNIYNEVRQLKGKTTEIRKIEKDEDYIEITSGYGSDSRGSWLTGNYTLEIVFMDRLIAIVPFSVGKHSVAGNTTIYPPSSFLTGRAISSPSIQEAEEETYEQTIERLEKMIGLEEVKQRIQDYTSFLQFAKIRKEKGLKEEGKLNLHLVFTGNPGTGKTTIAQMMGRIYKHLGLLSNGKLHEVGRAQLIGQYIGQTAPKVVEVIEKARGGVLFIDEAYSLVRSGEDSKDYGQEVIEVLVKEISDGKGDIAIVLAGYTQPMQTLLNSNPGLKSRFPIQFEFADYTPPQLLDIARLTERERDLSFTPEAFHILSKKIIEEYRKRDTAFGNARFVKSLISEAKMNLGVRIMDFEKPEDLSTIELSTIHAADVTDLKAGKKVRKTLLNLSIDEEELERSLAELNALIGLSEVKKQIQELITLVRFYQQTGRDVMNQFSLHMIFKGNPGTGKTTVARILANIYRALGILERGHLVECDRQSLVAGYIGQTAIKTKEQIDKAIGGVLFIDEAYALASNATSYNDFGKEALETVLKQMEDRRGEFIVVAAGYPQNMDSFIEINPGLKSRFDRTIQFQDFTVEELLNVANLFFEEENINLTDEAKNYLKNKVNVLFSQRDKYFGNARSIRTIAAEAIRQQHLRMAILQNEKRTPTTLETLEKEDLEKVSFDYENLTGKRAVGFSFKG